MTFSQATFRLSTTSCLLGCDLKHTPLLKGPLKKEWGAFSSLHHHQPISRCRQAAYHHRGDIISCRGPPKRSHTSPNHYTPPLGSPNHYTGISHTHGLEHSVTLLGQGGVGGEERRGEPLHHPLTSSSPPPPSLTHGWGGGEPGLDTRHVLGFSWVLVEQL